MDMEAIEDQFNPTGYLVDALGIDRAFKYVNDLIQLNPDDAHAYFLRGNLHEEMDETSMAFADYDRSISLNPTADAYAKRSSANFAEREYQKAAEDAEQAVSLNPNLMIAYVNRAVALTVLFRDAEAELALNRATELGLDFDFLRGGMESLRSKREAKIVESERRFWSWPTLLLGQQKV